MFKEIICWWSGGVTSAVACKIAIDLYGYDNCRVIFIDTKNEDEDTYRFLKDCEVWYGLPIERITHEDYNNIKEVWYRFKSLNVANGAICSSELKRVVREKWQKDNDYCYQVFGFDLDESKRVKSMALNHPKAKPIFPLWMYGYTKEDCIRICGDNGVEIPMMYKLGFRNNNCFKTGCVQGGVGYWQKMKREYPEKFHAMAKVEHELTDLKGSPVTMLRTNIKKGNDERQSLFLVPHPNYPDSPLFDEQKGREPEPLFECNGMCGVNDLSERSPTEKEINYQTELF